MSKLEDLYKSLEGTDLAKELNFKIVSRQEAFTILKEQIEFLFDLYEKEGAAKISIAFKLGSTLEGPHGINKTYFSPEELESLMETVLELSQEDNESCLSNLGLQILMYHLAEGPAIENVGKEVEKELEKQSKGSSNKIVSLASKILGL